jgi:hypothetical protein
VRVAFEQVSNWFINARVRLWKPMVEEMYAEEMKDDPAEEGDWSNANTGNGPNPGGEDRGGTEGGDEDGGGGERKPTWAQLLVHDAGSLASVVSIGSSRDQQQNLSFGLVMDHHLDFNAYVDHHAVADRQGFGGGSGVSLTLGLQQQHADPYGGVNVAFTAAPSAAAHEFQFMAGGDHQMDDGGGVFPGGHQFGAGLADVDTGVAASATNYPDRGLQSATGFQLLRDLAG